MDDEDDEVEDDISNEGEPEMITNHGFVIEDGNRYIKFKVKWIGFNRIEDQTWHKATDLTQYTVLVQEYMVSQGLDTQDLEIIQVEESHVAEMVKGEVRNELTWSIAMSLFDGVGGCA